MTDTIHMPKPDPKHTHLVAIEFRLNALNQELKDKRAHWAAECAEDTKTLREEIGAYKRRKAELLADVAQQWLPLDIAV
jgi:hypothetical protein